MPKTQLPVSHLAFSSHSKRAQTERSWTDVDLGLSWAGLSSTSDWFLLDCVAFGFLTALSPEFTTNSYDPFNSESSSFLSVYKTDISFLQKWESLKIQPLKSTLYMLH